MILTMVMWLNNTQDRDSLFKYMYYYRPTSMYNRDGQDTEIRGEIIFKEKGEANFAVSDTSAGEDPWGDLTYKRSWDEGGVFTISVKARRSFLENGQRC